MPVGSGALIVIGPVVGPACSEFCTEKVSRALGLPAANVPVVFAYSNERSGGGSVAEMVMTCGGVVLSEGSASSGVVIVAVNEATPAALTASDTGIPIVVKPSQRLPPF